MDLKLKDEITKLLIAEPGLSVSELAKKTGNYYSYTHKLISEMERQGLLTVKKIIKGKKEHTIIELTSDYKQEWVSDFKRFLYSILSDIEVKTALLLSYLFLIFNYSSSGAPSEDFVLTASESAPLIAPEPFNYGLVLLILIPALIIVWFLRKKIKK